MKAIQKLSLAVLAAFCLAGPACAKQGDPQPPDGHDASAGQVMSSPQVRHAMTGAMRILQQMDKASQKHGSPPRDPRRHNPAGPSDAVHDAADVARHAFGFAMQHPNASEADKQAAAEAMMSGIFSRELEGAPAPQPKPHSQPQTQAQSPASPPAKDYGQVDDDDGGQ